MRDSKLAKMYKEFPTTFWVLILSTFIDRFGGFLLFPFFAIYVTDHFDASMTQVGFLMMMMSIGSLLGSFIGGAVTDKIGRKKVILFGLIVSGLGSIAMGLVNDLKAFYTLALFLGFLGDLAGPARQAMIPDLLPKRQHAQGFGILRVVVNIAATIGPILGGFLASKSYLILFISDALFSCLTAIIVAWILPETKPEPKENEERSTLLNTLKGYKEVLKDGTYMLYISISAIMILVYMQMYSTLSVYLKQEHAFTPNLIGTLMSVNALLVVVFQIWVTRKLERVDPLKVMALGSLLFGIGFGMIGLVNKTYLFFIGMGIVTFGEMFTLPTSQGVVGNFAPEDKRGRYMAIFSFSWVIPNLFGGILAGIIMDGIDPNWVWYGCALLSVITILGFLLLNTSVKNRFKSLDPPKIDLDVDDNQNADTAAGI